MAGRGRCRAAARGGSAPGRRACQVFCVDRGNSFAWLLVTVGSGKLVGEPVAEADGQGVVGLFPAQGAGAALAALEGEALAVDVQAALRSWRGCPSMDRAGWRESNRRRG